MSGECRIPRKLFKMLYVFIRRPHTDKTPALTLLRLIKFFLFTEVMIGIKIGRQLIGEGPFNLKTLQRRYYIDFHLRHSLEHSVCFKGLVDI